MSPLGPVSLLHSLDAYPGLHLVLSLHRHLGVLGASHELPAACGNI